MSEDPGREIVHPPPSRPSPFKATEWRIIISILVLATITLFSIAFLELRDERLAFRMLTIIGLHVVGARAPAVLFCLAYGMGAVSTLLLNLYIEALLVTLVYYTFVLIVREGLESKLLKLAARQAEAAAQQHTSRIKKFELAGLVFFVMAPLPMTGPVTGSIVGYLLHLPPWKTFMAVFSGTCCALWIYVALGQAVLERLIAFQTRYQFPGTVAISLAIGIFTVYHVRSIYKWMNSLSDSGE